MELRIDRLTKEYGTKIAVDQFTYTMEEGVYGLLGANGAGKTTLMRMICDILTPTRGEVICDNFNIREMGEEYRNLLGYLPQDFGYYPNFTAEKFLLYMASLKGLEKNFARERTEELLELVGLYQIRKKKIKTFSGGMKQRLGIAQALLNNPKILVLGSEAEQYLERYNVGNIRNEKEGTVLRIISRECPGTGAIPVSPNLEDLYLSYFADTDGRVLG